MWAKNEFLQDGNSSSQVQMAYRTGLGARWTVVREADVRRGFDSHLSGQWGPLLWKKLICSIVRTKGSSNGFCFVSEEKCTVYALSNLSTSGTSTDPSREQRLETSNGPS